MEEEVNIALHNISQANNFFTFDLYKTLAVEPGNFFFSPLSIQIILALTFLGAKGNTARQMATGLHIGEDPAVVQYGVAALMNSLQEANDVRLDLANRIYLKAGYPIKEGFNSSASRFKAGVGEVDFLEEPKARKTINNWVENKTNHKIKEIIPSGYFVMRALKVSNCIVLLQMPVVLQYLCIALCLALAIVPLSPHRKRTGKILSWNKPPTSACSLASRQLQAHSKSQRGEFLPMA